MYLTIRLAVAWEPPETFKGIPPMLTRLLEITIGNNTIDNIETTWQLQSQIQTEWTIMNSKAKWFQTCFCLCNYNELKNRIISHFKNYNELKTAWSVLPLQLLASVCWGDDPVLSALRRYRDAAGSTFHPQSEAHGRALLRVEVLLEVLPTLCAFQIDVDSQKLYQIITIVDIWQLLVQQFQMTNLTSLKLPWVFPVKPVSTSWNADSLFQQQYNLISLALFEEETSKVEECLQM